MSDPRPAADHGPSGTASAGTPRAFDRTSRIVAIGLVASIIVPVVWLIISSALSGQDGFDENQPSGNQNRPSLRTTLPPLRSSTTDPP